MGRDLQRILKVTLEKSKGNVQTSVWNDWTMPSRQARIPSAGVMPCQSVLQQPLEELGSTMQHNKQQQRSDGQVMAEHEHSSLAIAA